MLHYNNAYVKHLWECIIKLLVSTYRMVRIFLLLFILILIFLKHGQEYLRMLLISFSMTNGVKQFFISIYGIHISLVKRRHQFSSVGQSCPTLCDPISCSTPGLPVHHQLPESTQTHVHWVSDAIQPSHPLPSPSPPALNLSQLRVFSNESALHIRWPKYWSFSFSISPYNEHPGLISFRMDWLDLLAIQGNLKSLLQHQSSKASVLQHSAFFIVQLSHLYVTTGKTITLTRWTFVGKVTSLLFNTLSRLVITFLPRCVF